MIVNLEPDPNTLLLFCPPETPSRDAVLRPTLYGAVNAQMRKIYCLLGEDCQPVAIWTEKEQLLLSAKLYPYGRIKAILAKNANEKLGPEMVQVPAGWGRTSAIDYSVLLPRDGRVGMPGFDIYWIAATQRILVEVPCRANSNILNSSKLEAEGIIHYVS